MGFMGHGGRRSTGLDHDDDCIPVLVTPHLSHIPNVASAPGGALRGRKRENHVVFLPVRLYAVPSNLKTPLASLSERTGGASRASREKNNIKPKSRPCDIKGKMFVHSFFLPVLVGSHTPT